MLEPLLRLLVVASDVAVLVDDLLLLLDPGFEVSDGRGEVLVELSLAVDLELGGARLRLVVPARVFVTSQASVRVKVIKRQESGHVVAVLVWKLS